MLKFKLREYFHICVVGVLVCVCVCVYRTAALALPMYTHRVFVCVFVCPTSAPLNEACVALGVSASSFIPPDIPASFLWAPEQLATPVGHFHNETITIYEPSATLSLEHTHTYTPKMYAASREP